MDDSERALRALGAVVEAHGGLCHQALHQRSSVLGSRGLFTNEALSAGDLILRVPLSSCLVAWPHGHALAKPQETGTPPECGIAVAATVDLVARPEVQDMSVCRCHTEDTISWGVYSGDYVRFTCGKATAYAIVNPPSMESDDDDDDASGQMGTPEQGTVWISSALHRHLGSSASAILEMVELEELTAIHVSAVTPLEHAATSAFFGTVDVTRKCGLLQDTADAADIHIDTQVVQYWQRYIDDERCHMRPAWRGLPIPSITSTRGDDPCMSGGYPARPMATSATKPVLVDAVIGKVGVLLAVGFVGPRTRVESAAAAGGEHAQSFEWTRDLAQQLYDEMLVGRPSAYHAYLSTLPESCGDCIWSWSTEELAELGNPHLTRAALGWADLREQCICHLCSTREPRPNALVVGRCVDLVVSRTLRLHENVAGCQTSTPFRVMVPLFDLMNHSVPNVAHTLVGECIEVRAKRAICLGEEIVHTFGLLAEQCLVTHGFFSIGGSFDLRTAGEASVTVGPKGEFDKTRVAALPLADRKALARACSTSLECLARLDEPGSHIAGGARSDLAGRYRAARRVALEAASGALVRLA